MWNRALPLALLACASCGEIAPTEAPALVPTKTTTTGPRAPTPPDSPPPAPAPLLDCSGLAFALAGVDGKLTPYYRDERGTWAPGSTLGSAARPFALYLVPWLAFPFLFAVDPQRDRGGSGPVESGILDMGWDETTWAPSRSVFWAGASTLVGLSSRVGGVALTAARQVGNRWAPVATADVGELAHASVGRDRRGGVHVAAMGDSGALLYTSLDGAQWLPMSPIRDLRVWRNEVETGGPVVAVREGMVSVFFLEHPTKLVAISKTDSGWTAPSRVAIPESVELAVTAASSRGAVVGFRTFDGQLFALTYGVEADGSFGPMSRVDEGLENYDGPGALAATTGLCGDDALFAYGAKDALKAARFKAGATPQVEIVGPAAGPPSSVLVERHVPYRD
ncbi:MAG: hypothetical protein IPG50_33605 [Myxococcales bacterium]|nr:hypothetical protein [Myxococcales bacterium]